MGGGGGGGGVLLYMKKRNQIGVRFFGSLVLSLNTHTQAFLWDVILLLVFEFIYISLSGPHYYLSQYLIKQGQRLPLW